MGDGSWRCACLRSTGEFTGLDHYLTEIALIKAFCDLPIVPLKGKASVFVI